MTGEWTARQCNPDRGGDWQDKELYASEQGGGGPPEGTAGEDGHQGPQIRESLRHLCHWICHSVISVFPKYH